MPHQPRQKHSKAVPEFEREIGTKYDQKARFLDPEKAAPAPTEAFEKKPRRAHFTHDHPTPDWHANLMILGRTRALNARELQSFLAMWCSVARTT